MNEMNVGISIKGGKKSATYIQISEKQMSEIPISAENYVRTFK